MKSIEGCQTCGFSSDGFCADLPAEARRDFNIVQSTALYPQGARLFLEGQRAHGIFFCAPAK